MHVIIFITYKKRAARNYIYNFKKIQLNSKFQEISIRLSKSDEYNLKITICPRHRTLYGIRWRCNQKCSPSTNWARHKSMQLKGDRGLTYVQSRGLYQLTNHLLHVGTRKYEVTLAPRVFVPYCASLTKRATLIGFKNNKNGGSI